MIRAASQVRRGKAVMAIRRREVHPDEVLTLKDGTQLPVVSDEAFLGTLLEVGRFACFAGGVITTSMLRHPTLLDGEMVTVGAVIEWKDYTNARAQPEPVAEVPQIQERADELEREVVLPAGRAFAAAHALPIE